MMCCNVDEAQLKQLYKLASGMICDTNFIFVTQMYRKHMQTWKSMKVTVPGGFTPLTFGFISISQAGRCLSYHPKG